MEEPQRRLTVAPGTEVGSPATRPPCGRRRGVLAGAVGVAKDDVVDPLLVEAGGAVEEGAERVRGEVVGPHPGERPAEAAEGSADDSIYVGGAHRPTRRLR